MNREEKIELIKDLKDAIEYTLSQYKEEFNSTGKALQSMHNDINKLEKKIKLDDLVTFCQTGRYPQ